MYDSEDGSPAHRRADALHDILWWFNTHHLGGGTVRHRPHVELVLDAARSDATATYTWPHGRTTTTHPGPTTQPAPSLVRVITADVLVVGAGPAGAAAATLLARAGRRVVVVDKARFPRDKCCGDGLTTLALRELESLGLDLDDVKGWHPVDAAWIRSPSGREISLPLPDDGLFAVTAPRRALDAALVDVARRAGADVCDGHAVLAVRQEADRVEADVEGLGTVTAHYLVAADGMWSPVRRMVGLDEPGYRGEWHAFRQYANGVTGRAAERLYVWFEPDLLPGYAWSFPLPGGRVNVGYGVLRDGRLNGKELRALWTALWQRPHIAEALGPGVSFEGRMAAWPIPAGIDRAHLAAGRVLLCGDAAMATDTMTGEGIGQALLTGRLAAEALLAAGAMQPSVAARRYTHDVRHHLVADHRVSHALNHLLRNEKWTRRALWAVDHSDWTRRNFARWMFEDEPRALLLTPSRWHRQVLRRPGPYRSRGARVPFGACAPD